MTIIGFERKVDGSKNIIVFDPMFHDSSSITQLIDRKRFTVKQPADALRAYRRGVKYLKKYNEFELLK
jgi:zinc finger-containing ubiquitin peptidase 1